MKIPKLLKSARLRNLVRGAISNVDEPVRRRTLNSARKIVSDRDADAFSAILVQEGLDSSIYGEPFPKSAADIFGIWRHLEPADIHLESTIQYYRLLHNAAKIEPAIRELSVLNQHILGRDFYAAVGTASAIIDEFGYSAAIIRKLLYIYSQIERDTTSDYADDVQVQLQRLMESVFAQKNRRLLNLYNSYLIDLFDYRSDLFSTIEIQAKMNHQATLRHKNLFQISMIQKTRFPCFEETMTCSHNLYLSGCSSLIDVFVDFCCISFYAEPPRSISLYFRDPDVSKLRELLTDQCTFSPGVIGAAAEESTDAEMYKIASVVPEIRALHRYRAALDSQLVVREPINMSTKSNEQLYFSPGLTIRDLIEQGQSPLNQIDQYCNDEASEILRSFAVLFCLNSGRDFSQLDADEIRSLLGQTTGFSYTLTIDEVLQLRDRGDQTDSPIISFLALIMLNERDPNDDREFELRMTFQKLLIDEYDENILTFLDWIHERTPGLCGPIVSLCDIAFLERLYLIYSSYENVLDQREQLCRWASEALNNPDYLALAEQLRVDAKVREIRGELDDTRIYVEEMRYKQWIVDNITPLLRRYQRHIEILGPSNTDAIFSPDRHSESAFTKKAGIESDVHLYYAVDMAFKEFCHNKTFGIDSYLSRRIRHGSLVGQLQAPIRSLINDFLALNESTLTTDQIEKLEGIYKKYSMVVRELKDEQLQFRSKRKPDGLLSSDAFGSQLRVNAFNVLRAQLSNLFKDGLSASMLVEAFPSLCWGLLEMDLSKVRDEIVASFQSRARPILRQIKSVSSSDPIWISLQYEIDQKAHESFKEILRWFYRPERSSMSVSITELAEVVKNEVNSYRPESTIDFKIIGESEGTVSGITYHTVYDIFYVLFDNAALYAKPSVPMNIRAKYVTDKEGNSAISISVESTIRDNDDQDTVRSSINSSLADDVQPHAMVREGKSGLGKARWVIENYPKPGQFCWNITDNLFVFEFSLPVVLVKKA